MTLLAPGSFDGGLVTRLHAPECIMCVSIRVYIYIHIHIYVHIHIMYYIFDAIQGCG